MEGKLQIAGVGHSCLDRLCTIESYPREDDSTHVTSIAVQGGGAVVTARGRAGGDEDGTYLRQAFWERELGGEQYIYKNYRKTS